MQSSLILSKGPLQSCFLMLPAASQLRSKQAEGRNYVDSKQGPKELSAANGQLWQTYRRHIWSAKWPGEARRKHVFHLIPTRSQPARSIIRRTRTIESRPEKRGYRFHKATPIATRTRKGRKPYSRNPPLKIKGATASMQTFQTVAEVHLLGHNCRRHL